MSEYGVYGPEDVAALHELFLIACAERGIKRSGPEAEQIAAQTITRFRRMPAAPPADESAERHVA